MRMSVRVNSFVNKTVGRGVQNRVNECRKLQSKRSGAWGKARERLCVGGSKSVVGLAVGGY